MTGVQTCALPISPTLTGTVLRRREAAMERKTAEAGRSSQDISPLRSHCLCRNVSSCTCIAVKQKIKDYFNVIAVKTADNSLIQRRLPNVSICIWKLQNLGKTFTSKVNSILGKTQNNYLPSTQEVMKFRGPFIVNNFVNNSVRSDLISWRKSKKELPGR